MSFIETHGKPGVGILPLQHHGHVQKRFDLDYRAFKAAVRVVDRPRVKGVEFGHWKEDPETRGDVIGSFVWVPDFRKRPIAGWRFSWPVEVEKGSGSANSPDNLKSLGLDVGKIFGEKPPGQGAPQPTGQGACAVMPGVAMRPLWKPDMRADTRFPPKNVFRPKYATGEYLWPKFPVGWKGIALAGDDENEQTEYFLPTDPRLPLVHVNGDPEMGANVVDMGPNFQVDPNRHGRLHTILRVIKGPTGCVNYHGRNSVAVNFTDAGCEDVRGGLWVDRGPNSTSGKARIVATFGQRDSGPLECGLPGDKHTIGQDADGNPIHGGHVSMNSYFWQSPFEDGPLQYDGIFSYERSGAPDYYTPGVFFTDVYFEFDPKLDHPFVCGPRKGKYKWRSVTIIYIPSEVPPEVPPPPPPPPPEVPTGDDGGIPVPTGDTGGGGVPDTPDIKRGGIPAFGVLDGGGGIPFDQVCPIPSGDTRRDFAAVPFDFAAPSILGRPQFVNDCSYHDLRGYRGRLEDYQRLDQAPIVGRIEAFGQQSESHWVYQDTPRRGHGRFLGGTAAGGWAMMPPQVDMADELTNFAPPGVTTSATYFVATPGTCFAAGIPDVGTGTVRTGWRWGADSAGDMTFDRMDSSAAATTLIHLDNADNHVGIGTTAPTNLLHVQDDSDIPAVFRRDQAASGVMALRLANLGADTAGHDVGLDAVFNNAAGSAVRYGSLRFVIRDRTTSLHDGRLLLYLFENGVETVQYEVDQVTGYQRWYIAGSEKLRLSANGLVIEPGGVSASAAANYPLNVIEANGGSVSYALFQNNNSGGGGAAGDEFCLLFQGEDDGGTVTSFSAVRQLIKVATDGSEEGEIRGSVADGATLDEMFRISKQGCIFGNTPGGYATSYMQSSGSFALPVLPTTVSDALPSNVTVTLDETHAVLVGIVTGSTRTLTYQLPAATSCPGRHYLFKGGATVGTTITIQRAGSDDIEGATTTTITTAYQRIGLFSDGTSRWYQWT